MNTETRNGKPKQILSTKSALIMLAYVGSIVLSNWLVVKFGVIQMLPGIYGPAGVYFIGVTLVMRDLLQDRVGPLKTIPFLLLGAVISAFFSPALALASVAGFLIAELMDMAVYTPLRKKGWILAAVLASNAVGILLDTFVFLMLAFGSLEFAPGQIIGKIIGTLVAAVVLPFIYRNQRDKRPHYVKKAEAEEAYV